MGDSNSNSHDIITSLGSAAGWDGYEHVSICTKIRRKHGWDTLLTVLMGVLFFVCQDVLPVSDYPFREQDDSLSYEVKPRSITLGIDVIVSIVLPYVIMISVMLFLRWREDETVYSSDFYRGQLALAQAIVFAESVVHILKIYIGRQRPNFLALCDYKGFRSNFTHYKLNTEALAWGDFKDCLASEKDIRNSRIAFPSGTSALAFAGCGFIAIFCMASCQFNKFNKMGKALVIGMFLVGPTMMAATGIKEFYNFNSDVIAGSLIGLSCAVWSFTHNYVGIQPSRASAYTVPGSIYANPDMFAPALRSLTVPF